MNALQVIEITIPVPFGHVAAKWWGPRNVRPVVAIHGWQDNAGTFDTLIPLLPVHVGYLAIDMPGHGLSSPIPHGTIYSHLHYLHVLNTIFKRHFKWPRVSLLAHSMGSALCYLYASTFPDYVDMFIGIDLLTVRLVSSREVKRQLNVLGKKLLTADERNQTNTEPPTYTYEGLIDTMVKGTNGSVHREAAPYILQRGTKLSQVQADRFYFSRDSRTKFIDLLRVTPEMNRELAARIRCPYLFIKALESPYSENRAHFEEILEIMQEFNPRFELLGVDGTHHVHLSDPIKVAGKISSFIEQYRPSGMSSKL